MSKRSAIAIAAHPDDIEFTMAGTLCLLREAGYTIHYLRDMDETSLSVGRLSRRFQHAEGWRRHLHMGFCPEDSDPMREALGKKYLINAAYERSLTRG